VYEGTVVTLGDCSSNGNNILAHLVNGDDTTVMTYSLQYHKKFDPIIKWFLQNKKQGSIIYNGYLSPTNLKSVALKHLRQQEIENSWPNHLQFENCVNFSLNGNHFGYYLIQIKRYLQENPKPKLVLITDYTPDHMFLYFKNNGNRYQLLVNHTYLEDEYDKFKHKHPEHLHSIVLEKIQREHNLGRDYAMRKSQRMLSVLEKFLAQQNIPSVRVMFRQEFTSIFSTSKVIDLRQIKDSWLSGNDDYSGDLCKIKLEAQKTCSDIVNSYINDNMSLDKIEIQG
jgi:hypothetical protein